MLYFVTDFVWSKAGFGWCSRGRSKHSAAEGHRFLKSHPNHESYHLGEMGFENGALRGSGGHFLRRWVFVDFLLVLGEPQGLRQYTSEVVELGCRDGRALSTKH